MYAAFGWVDALVLGLVQGLTEFLPISSSAHLRILGPLLPGGGDPGAAFTAITQLGTELAVLIYFRRDVTRMLLAWWRSLPRLGREALSVDAKVAWLVILGTIPICVLGLLLRDLIETTFRTLLLTAIMLIVFGVILAWAERRGSQTRSIAQLTVKDGVLLGLAVSVVLVHVVNPQSFHWTMEMNIPAPRLWALCAAVVVSGTVTAWLAGRAAAGRDAVMAVKEDW